jgi:hypothetical protein
MSDDDFIKLARTLKDSSVARLMANAILADFPKGRDSEHLIERSLW